MKIFTAVFLLIFLFSSCGKTHIEEEPSPLPVRMVPVTVKENIEEVNGFGSLSFLKKFELLSPLEGILENLNYREGDRIRKGDIVGVLKNPQVNLAARRSEDAYSQALAAMNLASARLRDVEFGAERRLLENEKARDELVQAKKILDEEKRKSLNREALYKAGGLSDEAIREERFRMAQAEEQINFMERDLEIREIGLRERDLASAGFPVPPEKEELKKALIRLATSASRAEADAARANLEAASREMESSLLMENELIIKSPGPGVIAARYMEEGERIRRDDRILTIMETGSLYAVFQVSEADAPKLNKGMSARITAGTINYEGRVDLVSPQADNQSFTFMVRVLLSAQEGGHLKPGMFARVSIPLESPRKITVIPETALAFKKDNSGRVFTIRNNVLSERDVVLGALMGDEREIVSGLAPGEVVVLDPNPAYREGVYVSTAR